MAAVAWGADPQVSVRPPHMDPLTVQIRVMYADRNNILSEYAWNPNNQWQPGTLQQLDLTQQGLGLTATIVTGKNIRLYYLPNSTSAVAPIIELASTGDTWTQTSATIKTGFRFRGGTSLASTAWRDSLGNHIRIYYASEFASVQEMSFDDNVSGGWRQCKHFPPVSNSTSLMNLQQARVRPSAATASAHSLRPSTGVHRATTPSVPTLAGTFWAQIPGYISLLSIRVTRTTIGAGRRM